MLTKAVHFLTIMLYVLVSGVMWGTWVSLARTMTSYSPAVFLADGQHMIANLASLMPVLIIAGGVLNLILIILLFRGGTAAAAWLAVVALIALVGVLVITLAVEVPIDNDIKTWTVDTLPSNWADTRQRWANFHTLRTFVSLAGVAAAVLAALAYAPAPGRHSAGQR
jgi:uncharacterized membrane protein